MLDKLLKKRAPKQPGQQKVRRKGIGVATFGLLVFVIGSLILAGVGLYLTVVTIAQGSGFQDRLASQIFKGYEQHMSRLLSTQDVVAGVIIRRGGLDALLAAGDARKIADEEALLRDLFPGATGVRILPAGFKELAAEAPVSIGYADLDLLRQIEAGKAPTVEVHVFKTKQQHFDRAWPVKDTSGRVVGHLFVQFPLAALDQSLAEISSGHGRLELVQSGGGDNNLVVAGTGSAGDGGVQSAKVANTRWTLRFQSDLDTFDPFGDDQFQFLIVVGGGMLAFAALLFLLFRWLATAVRRDQATLLHLVKDMVTKNVKPTYKIRLYDFQDSLTVLRGMAREVATVRIEPKPQPAPPPSVSDSVAETDFAPESAAEFKPVSPATRSTIEAPPEVDAGMIVEEHSREMPAPEAPKSSPTKVVEPEPAVPVAPPPTAMPDEIELDPDHPLFQNLDAPSGAHEVDPALFRAYDIRGVVGRGLDTDLAYEIGRALGSEAYERGVQTLVVGRDGRHSSEDLVEALGRGLLATGRHVVDVGMVPTPVVYFAAELLTEGSGVMVTGSHNPADYNGFKMVLRGETLREEQIQQLRKRVEDRDYLAGDGEYRMEDVLGRYIERIAGDIQLKKPQKIVIDCGNGVAGVVAEKLYRQIGCEVIPLFCEVDGDFPNHHPDPSVPENLIMLMSVVAEEGADLGLAFDGDGDRLGVVDIEGRIIWPDQQMILFSEDLLKRSPGATVIFDVKCSRNLARAIKSNGGKPLMWKTGHSLIKAKMQQTGALLGGEMSGHIFFREGWFGFDDALYAGARLLKILASDADKRTPTEVFAALPSSVATPEIRVDVSEGEQHRLVKKFIDAAQFESARSNNVDGLRVDFPDGWGLLRASNTQPALVLRFEADSEGSLQRIQALFRDQLTRIKPDLELPF